MSRQSGNRSRIWPACTIASAAGVLLAIAACCTTTGAAAAQGPTTPPGPGNAASQPIGIDPAPPPAQTTAPGTAVVGPGEPSAAAAAAPPGTPLLEPDVQVVRFQGPPGLTVEVLSPQPAPVPAGDGGGIITVGLKRGVGYQLKIDGIPERPGRQLYPVIELVGHLHRPAGIDPAKFPIRVVFNQDDLNDTVDQGRLVTKIIYLEDPDQAIPFHLPKDEVPVLTLGPSEPPLRIAQALGRPIAIVRLGMRQPTIEELQFGPGGDAGLEYAERSGSGPCPFLSSSGSRCGQPCGPVCTPAPRPQQPSLPRDEYLCDGGDRGTPAAAGRTGRVGGIDPRDTVVAFDIGKKGRIEPRVLPTNVVCIYAPRFAEVRTTTGPNQTVDIQHLNTDKHLTKYSAYDNRAWAKKLVQNQDAQLTQDRARAMGVKGRIFPDEKSNNRGATAVAGGQMTVTDLQLQSSELARNRQKVGQLKEKIRLDGIKTAEGPVVTGIAESASESVRVWAPHQMTGVEVPPDRPGLAVIKRVSAAEAEPGDTVTYVIFYRNMGNTPITNVSIVDSLLPRLEYVKGTSRGPEGTAFSAAMNRVGSTELRWILPAALPPGAAGHVSFNATIR